jgi:hypothetical protein
MLQVVLWALLALPGLESPSPPRAQTPRAAQPSRQQSKATTRNPHGPTLTIPCENCHRVTEQLEPLWRILK